MNKIIIILLVGVLISSCDKNSITNPEKKEFKTSFETVNDFSGFYLTPQDYLGTTFHELSDSIVKDGIFAHKAWINGANSPSTIISNNNHRGYSTIQFQKTTDGVFITPCLITIWVWLNMELLENQTGEEDD